MKLHLFLFVSMSVIVGLVLAGCSSSGESQNAGTYGSEQTTPPQTIPTPPPASSQKTPEKIDTVTVTRQDTQRPTYDTTTPPPMPASAGEMPKGNCSIQLGAYKMPDNADRIIALAKQRFNQPVYLFLDKSDMLYKVMMGDFPTKDAARSFRDAIAQQYPNDYKDAWVWEKPQR